MAICGRCGLWNKYPENHHEQKYAGVCMWYQMRLHDSDVWEERKCPDFFERIPGMHPMDHMDYKIKRDNLGSAYSEAKFSKKVAFISLALSITALLYDLVPLVR